MATTPPFTRAGDVIVLQIETNPEELFQVGVIQNDGDPSPTQTVEVLGRGEAKKLAAEMVRDGCAATLIEKDGSFNDFIHRSDGNSMWGNG